MNHKFLVKIPLDPDNLDSGYREIKFKTYREICEYLGVGITTVRTIAEGTAKFVFDKTKHLQGIKIERIEPPKSDTPPKSGIDRKEYLKALHEKALLLKDNQ